MTIPPPPSGFTLVNTSTRSASVPPPPPGFQVVDDPNVGATIGPALDAIQQTEGTPLWQQRLSTEVEDRQQGRRFGVVKESPDGTKEYGYIYDPEAVVNPPAPLSPSELQALRSAYQEEYGYRPGPGNAGPNPVGQLAAQAQAIGQQQYLQNLNPVENYAASIASMLANYGTGAVGTVAPELANQLRENTASQYLYDPSKFSGFLGEVTGNAIPLLPAMLTGPASAAVYANITAGTLGASQFGSVRMQVDELRRRGQNITIQDELTAAALSAAAEFVFERIGIGAIQQVNAASVAGPVRNALFQYAKAAGINASEEYLTQVAQNAVEINILKARKDYTEGADKAALMGGIIGSGGRLIHNVAQQPPVPQFALDSIPVAPRDARPYTIGQDVRVPDANPIPVVTEGNRGEIALNERIADPNAIPVAEFPQQAPEQVPVGGTEGPALPAILQGKVFKARVTEGDTSRGVALEFQSGIDKALYALTQPRKGKVQAEATKYLQAAGLSPQQIEQEAKLIADTVATEALSAPDDRLTIPPTFNNLRPDPAAPSATAQDTVVPTTPDAPTLPPVAQPKQQTQPIELAPVQPKETKPYEIKQARSSAAVAQAPQGPVLKQDETQGRLFLPEATTAVEAASGQVKNFRRAAPRTREQADVAQAFRKRGVEIVFYDGEGRGFRMKQYPGVLFVNRNQVGEGLREAVVHEFVHELHDSRPELYQELLASLPESDRQAIEQWYTEAFQAMRPGETPADLGEEGVTTPFGKIAVDDRVWRAVVGRNPTLARRILDVFRNFITKLGLDRYSVGGQSFKKTGSQIAAAIRAFEATLSIPVTRRPREADPAPSFLPSPNDRVREEAQAYTREAGLAYDPDTTYATVDVERAKQIAAWYDTAESAPADPQVKASYAAMMRETKAQYEFLVKQGVRFEPWTGEGQPYANSEEMLRDVRENRRLRFFLTEGGFGSDAAFDASTHPLLERTGITLGGKEMVYNDLFRAVHDYFGHAKEGVGFGPRGEENAWRSHSQMFSPLARKAMSAETRGQNSWVNYGPFGEQNQADPKNTRFADQKAVLMPEQWVSVEREGGTSFLPPSGTAKREKALGSIESTRLREEPLNAEQDMFGTRPQKPASVHHAEVARILNERTKKLAGEAKAHGAKAESGSYSRAAEAVLKGGRYDLERAFAGGEGGTADEAGADAVDAGLFPGDDGGGVGGGPSFLPSLNSLARRGGDLPPSVTSLNQGRQGAISAEQTEAEFRLKELDDAIRKEYGKAPQKLTTAEVQTLNDVLAGKAPGVTVPAGVRAALQKMRDHVDSLSTRLMGSSLVDPALAAILGKNLGQYLNRSYRVFDDAKWAKKIPASVRANAVKFIEGQLIAAGKSPALAPVYVEELIEDWRQGGVDSLFAKGKLGAKNLTILKARKDIAPEIRALMGEHQNPFTNYAKSIGKMSALLSNHAFLEQVKADGMGKYLFEDDTAKPGFTTQIAAPATSSMAPLNGLRTSPEIAKAFADYNKSADLPGWLRVWAGANFAAKSAKTVFSLMTQMRNLIGQPFFHMLSGHYRVSNYGKAYKAALADLTKRGTPAVESYIKKLTTLGVMGQGVQANEVLADIKDMGLTDADVYTESGFLPAVKRGVRKALMLPQQAYQVSDTLGKIVGFENELTRAREAYPTKSPAEQEAIAAERVLNTYPTYSRVPPVVQALRRQPFVGPFVAFWYESFRTIGNSIAYAKADLASGDKARMRHGAERLVGLGALAAGTVGVAALTKALMGVDDEEEEAYRKFLPSWSKGNVFAFTGRDGQGNLRTIDLSALNPYSPVIDSAYAIAAGEGSLPERLSSAVAEFFQPLTSEQIFTAAVADVARNQTESGRRVYNPEDEDTQKVKDVLAHMFSAIEPGTLDRFRNRILPGLRGEETGFGDAIKPADEITAELTGVKTRTFNFQTGLSFEARKFDKATPDIASLFLREAGRNGRLDPDKTVSAYRKMEETRFRRWKDMHEKIVAAQRAGVAVEDVFVALTRGGLGPETAKQLIGGAYVPYNLKGPTLKAIVGKHDEFPLDQIIDINADYAGKELK